MQESIFIGGAGSAQNSPQRMLLRFANCHGLIAGATGTGKTITLQIVAEAFSRAGVPVFLADVKGDLSGLSKRGNPQNKLHEKLLSRAAKIGLETYAYHASSVCFWDVLGQAGLPLRVSIAEIGPFLLARLLDLNEVQEGVLNIAFRLADDEGLLLLDLKDLRAVLSWMSTHRAMLTQEYGMVSSASIGAIQRRLLMLEDEGGHNFFAEPGLKLAHLMRSDPQGRGMISILDATQLMQMPRLYGTVLLWLLSELFESLPEIGDPEKPRLVLFFDEAHLLFDDAPKALLDKVEQVVRLIRSKGVGVFFVTQNPDDVPPDILGQLGNRVQHALRAFTARDRKALRLAAQTYRDNPAFETEDVLQNLGVGEALTTFLDPKGAPGMVARTLIRPPASQIGPITAQERQDVIQADFLHKIYNQTLDRHSAYEMLLERQAEAAQSDAAAEEVPAGREYRAARRFGGAHSPKSATSRARDEDLGGRLGSAMANALVKELSGTTGRRIIRGVLGGLFRR